VLIDGRSKYMSGQDLASYLKSVPGAQVDKIELIDNPSARYDAAGNAVINIRLKKNRTGGLTGNISTGFTQGKYLRSNNSLNLNYNYRKINVFGNMGYSYNKEYTDDSYDRRFFTVNDKPSSAVSLYNSQRSRNNGINANLGLDYSATENTTYGFQVNLNDSRNNGSLDYNSGNYSDDHLDSTGKGSSRGTNKRNNISTNVNLVHKFGKTGRELSADLNYLSYDGSNVQYLQSFIYQPDDSLTGNNEFFYDLPSSMHIYTAKADYIHPLKGKGRLETGFKSSWVNNDNVSDYYRVFNNERLIDNGQSNHFKYRENINAAYVNAQKSWKYFGLQLGMRIENTIANGDQIGNEVVEGSHFRKNYTKIFPALFLSYKLDTTGTNTFSFAITKRINRPNYQLLNEFLIFRDQYSYSTGNSMLNPQYQNRYEVKYQYKQLLRVGLSYNRFSDVIFQTTRVVDEVFITRPENVAKGYMLLLNTGISLSPAKWWSLNTDILLSRIGLNGDSYGIKLNPETYVARLNVLNQFQFGSGWSAELGGYYASRDLNGQLLPVECTA
jgi:outer membrane receptor protein involved in Fe transport